MHDMLDAVAPLAIFEMRGERDQPVDRGPVQHLLDQ